MNKRYAIGDYSYKTLSEVIDMINNNCDVNKEKRIPIKFYHDGKTEFSWYIECLDEKDEPRLEKHLNYIYQIEG